ncbi:hypothetical protein [Arenimonas fontis]|uniref:Uncharacterized protein n=1 Tax=Arenimonas fontis TaxID=2608255 RepID=A0A5B2ZA11_9GAMM|nr:hypothetical protein [Arenimonas fontis]KAA2284859.1 hypothetical protein F0415_06280 [Arenimonas fontis]
MNDLPAFFLRLGLAGILADRGLAGLAGAAALTVALPSVLAMLAALALLVGYQVRALALAAGLLALVQAMSMPWDFRTALAGLPVAGHLLTAVGLLALALLGPGGFSLDAWLRRRLLRRLECGCAMDGAFTTARSGWGQRLADACVEARLRHMPAVLRWLRSPGTGPDPDQFHYRS